MHILRRTRLCRPHLFRVQFTKSFTQDVLQWFNVDNNSNFNLNTEDFLFGLSSVLSVLTKKLNDTLLFLRYYIYKRKLQNDSPPLLLPDFINKIKPRFRQRRPNLRARNFHSRTGRPISHNCGRKDHLPYNSRAKTRRRVPRYNDNRQNNGPHQQKGQNSYNWNFNVGNGLAPLSRFEINP